MSKNIELMRNIIEAKKQKSSNQKNNKRPDRYSRQSAGSTNTH